MVLKAIVREVITVMSKFGRSWRWLELPVARISGVTLDLRDDGIDAGT